MKKKNKTLIQIIAAVLFVVGFVLCGCDKNLADSMGEQSSIQRNRPSPITQAEIPTVSHAAVKSGNLVTEIQYDFGGYGSYTP
jgi:hypothetical protein